MHVIGGLPRSGSTLLCNILNQNPKFWASSTSILPALLNSCINQWSTSLEVKADLDRDRQTAEDRIIRTARALCEAWHQRDDGKLIFDKSRGWNSSLLAFAKAFPEGKAIMVVRDLRNVFASIEKQHRKNPLLDEFKTINDKAIYSRADKMFSPGGLIGGPIVGIEDILRRNLPVYVVRYESFTRAPAEIMHEMYAYLGLHDDLFIHDFDNIENTATDPDGFHNYKFPHEGSGKVVPSNNDAWKEFLSEDLAKVIMGRFPYYNSCFGYA